MEERKLALAILLTMACLLCSVFYNVTTAARARDERQLLHQEIVQLHVDMEMQAAESEKALRVLNGEVQYFLTGGWK